MVMEMFCSQTVFINVNIMVGIAQHSFARCYYRKLGKGYKESLFYFLQFHVNLQLPQNKKCN